MVFKNKLKKSPSILKIEFLKDPSSGLLKRIRSYCRSGTLFKRVVPGKLKKNAKGRGDGKSCLDKREAKGDLHVFGGRVQEGVEAIFRGVSIPSDCN